MSEVNDEVELPAPSGETNAQAFKRLAKARVNVTIKRIQLIGNLSNRSSYAYSDEQVDKMFAVLYQELDTARNRFRAKDKDRPAFDFDD